MEKDTVLGIMLTSLLIAVSISVFDFHSVKARPGTYITINVDGTVSPDTAPIQRDGDIYTFTDDITTPTYYGIHVWKSNITINGNGYTLKGATSFGGFRLSDVSNVTIKNTNITVGEWAGYEHPAGFELDNANYCTFFGNNITNLRYGVMAYSDSSTNNRFYHNSFINNDLQVNIATDFANFWDNGYPSGGNYWSHLTEVDYFSGPNQDQLGSDGIGDIPYLITRLGTTTEITNIDRYPLGGTSECVGMHDVAVTNVTPCKTIVGQNYFMFIKVTVENQGDFLETLGVATPYYDGVAIPSSVRWESFWSMGDVNRDGYIDIADYDLIVDAFLTVPGDPNWNPDADLNQDLLVSGLDATICAFHMYLDIWTYSGLPLPSIGTQRGVKLFPGTQTLNVTWNTTGVPCGNYTINATATPVPCETETTDNNCTDGLVLVSVVGDVNGDCMVTGLDVLIATSIANFMQTVPPANPNVDVDSDNMVTGLDVLIITSIENFMKECPP